MKKITSVFLIAMFSVFFMTSCGQSYEFSELDNHSYKFGDATLKYMYEWSYEDQTAKDDYDIKEDGIEFSGDLYGGTLTVKILNKEDADFAMEHAENVNGTYDSESHISVCDAKEEFTLEGLPATYFDTSGTFFDDYGETQFTYNQQSLIIQYDKDSYYELSYFVTDITPTLLNVTKDDLVDCITFEK